MSAVAVEIVVLLALIVANGAFALSEIALVSSRRVRLEALAEQGSVGAAAALDLVATPERFLSAVQVGITLIGILTGAIGGATLAGVVADGIGRSAALEPFSRPLGLAVVVVATTYLSLVFGELAPKRIALANPERVAAAVALPMRQMARLTAPIVWLLSGSTTIVTRLLGLRPSQEPPVTEEELTGLLRLGTEAGVFESSERSMVEAVLLLADQPVAALATPRVETVWLDLSDPPEEMWRQIATHREPQYLVCDGGPDRVVGIVRSVDLLVQCVEQGRPDLRSALRPPIFVPETTRVFDLLERFRAQGAHTAVVLDEHGGTEGSVTLLDVLERISGEIPLQGEATTSAAFQREDGSWLVDGLLPVRELQALLGLHELPRGGAGRYHSTGGFIVAGLDRIPSVGDSFVHGGWRFEVVDMDGLRVDKVLARPAGHG